MTIFRAGHFQPSAIVAHEISKPASIRIPGVLDEGRKACGVDFGQQLRFTGTCKCT